MAKESQVLNSNLVPFAEAKRLLYSKSQTPRTQWKIWYSRMDVIGLLAETLAAGILDHCQTTGMVTKRKRLKSGIGGQTMTEPELKPCPFCGSEKVKVYDHFWKYSVNCLGCGASTGISDVEKEAIEKWNRRPEPEKPKVKTIPLSSLKDSDYVWIVGPRCGLYRSVEKAKKEFPDWHVPAFLCEVDVPTINFDTFDQRIFDLVDDSGRNPREGTVR